MRFASAALVASLAALSHALLIPSTIGGDDVVKDARYRESEEHRHPDLFHAFLQHKNTVIDLHCPECPYFTQNSDEGITWETGIDNKIHLEFDTLIPGLRLNSHQIYPFAKLVSSPEIQAFQIRTDNHERSVEFPINFALEQSSPIQPPIPGVEIIPLRLTIVGLHGVPIKVDSILLHILKTPDNEHHIAKIDTIPFETTPGAKSCTHDKNWSLRRIKSIITSHLMSILDAVHAKTEKAHAWLAGEHYKPGKGKASKCGKSKDKHHKSEDKHHKSEDKHHKSEDKHHKSEDKHHKSEDKHHKSEHKHHKSEHKDKSHTHKVHNHHHHRHHHRLARMLRKTLRFFVVPALLGVCGGLAASAIGMLVGRAIVFVWCKLVRRGERGLLRLRESDVIIMEHEKQGLLIAELADESVHQPETPPRYSDVENEATTTRVDEKH